MLKGLSNMASLMKQARELQGKAADLKERLKSLRVEGSSGGGMVTVEAAGDQQLVSCRIEQSLLVSGDRELLEDLVVAAANQALDRARQAAAESMQQLAGDLNMPALNEALAKFGLGPGGEN